MLMKSNMKTHETFIVDNMIEDTINNANELCGYNAIDRTYDIDSDLTIESFDIIQQSNWFMPEYYKNFDIVGYILDECNGNNTELQRCGQELLLYQQKNLIPLLQYLKYLVDTMEKNKIIWGVGRGSSVASFVLYKLKIHRINSIEYDLAITEFFRRK